ncbi:MAG: DUF2306 domain-containing protein [Planctomycetota bacterium]
MRTLLSSIFWTAVAFSAVAVLGNSLGYLLPGGSSLFLQERPNLFADPVWRAALSFHVGGALVCLFTGMPLMLASFLRWSPRAHRTLGRVYVIAVCAVAGPAGLYLSLFSKGGVAGAAGFIAIGSSWIVTTWVGWSRVRAGALASHIRWMGRSYALALSAITFRWLQVGLYFIGVPDDRSYVASLWLSFAGSWVIASKSVGWLPSPVLLVRFTTSQSSKNGVDKSSGSDAAPTAFSMEGFR